MLASNFLIPNGTIIVELVLFIVVLGIVAKYILPPINKVMDERAQAVRASLDASNAGQAEADRLAGERRSTLDDARVEARRTLEHAAAEASRLVEEARAAALAAHAEQLNAARPGLLADRARLTDEVLAGVGSLVTSAASRVIGEPIDASRHRSTIDALVGNARREVGS